MILHKMWRSIQSNTWHNRNMQASWYELWNKMWSHSNTTLAIIIKRSISIKCYVERVETSCNLYPQVQNPRTDINLWSNRKKTVTKTKHANSYPLSILLQAIMLCLSIKQMLIDVNKECWCGFLASVCCFLSSKCFWQVMP